MFWLEPSWSSGENSLVMLMLPASGCGLGTLTCVPSSVFSCTVNGQSCCCTPFISQPESGALWEIEWQWMGPELCFPRMFSKKLFYFRTHRLTWMPAVIVSGRSHWRSHWSSPLGRSMAHRSQGDRRQILLLMPICGKVSPLWLSLWKCVFHNCFMIIKVLQ